MISKVWLSSRECFFIERLIDCRIGSLVRELIYILFSSYFFCCLGGEMGFWAVSL